MNSVKRFFKNKNTVTFLGVIVIVGILYFWYYYQLQKQVKPVSVPVAATTIQPRTEITSDMIKYVEVPEAYISSNVIRNEKELISKYSNYNTMIPEGSMFYKDTVVSEKMMPNYLLKLLNKDEYLITMKLDDEHQTYGIMPGDKVDIYMRVVSDEGNVMFGKFIENLEVLAVTDNDGNLTYETTDGSVAAEKLIFGVKEDMFLLLLRSNYIDVEFRPVQHGAWIDDTKTTTNMTTQELIDYLNARITTLSTDPQQNKQVTQTNKIEEVR